MPDDLVRIGDYPQLRRIAWQLRKDTEIAAMDALEVYERNWRHVDQSDLEPRERAFIEYLANTYSGGRLLV